MEDCIDDRRRKRTRVENLVDPEIHSPGLKITRVEPGSSEKNLADWDGDADSSGCQLTRLDSSGSSVNSNDSDQLPAQVFNSPEAKRIQDDLLNIIDESVTMPDRDLESIMRSFQEEIMIPVSASVGSEVMTGLGDTQSDLGYLLEASDDELGLPPTEKSGKEKCVNEGIDSIKDVSDTFGFSGFTGFDEMPGHDSFQLGLGTESGSSNVAEFVTFDGLFEYPESGDGLWRYESLQAQ